MPRNTDGHIVRDYITSGPTQGVVDRRLGPIPGSVQSFLDGGIDPTLRALVRYRGQR